MLTHLYRTYVSAALLATSGLVLSIVAALPASAQSTTRVSVASDGTEGNQRSIYAAISTDGRQVAFASLADNLVPDDTFVGWIWDEDGEPEGWQYRTAEDIFVHDRWTGQTVRVSLSSEGDQANWDCGSPAVSADGRFVVFNSCADNLVEGDNYINWCAWNPYTQSEMCRGAGDVFVRDRDPDGNGIFDEGNEVTVRVSLAHDGEEGNNNSGISDISGDGRFVAFRSRADNLVPSDTNFTWYAGCFVWSVMEVADVALHNVWGSGPDDVYVVGNEGTLLHYCCEEGWTQIDTGMPPDRALFALWGSGPDDVFAVGHWGTVLHYDGTGWTAGNIGSNASLRGVSGTGPNDVYAVGSAGRIYHYDGTDWTLMTTAAVGLAGVWAAGPNDAFSVGSTGTILRYDGSNWTPMDSGTDQSLAAVWGRSADDVFVVGGWGTILHYNGVQWSPMDSGTVWALTGVWGNGPEESVFAVGGPDQLLRFDGAVWMNQLIFGGTENLRAVWGSGDHNFFAVDGNTFAIIRNWCPDSALDVFVHDRDPDENGIFDEGNGVISLVSVNSAGEQGNESSEEVSISADGRYVAFESIADNLVAGDTNGGCVWHEGWEVYLYASASDIFVHDRTGGGTVRVSVASDGTESDGDSNNPDISADGRFVAFRSFASNLVPDDNNGVPDVFVHDRDPDENGIFDEGNGVTARVSVSSAGEEGNGDSDLPTISAHGRFVAFESEANNLVPDDTNDAYDVFVHDHLTGRTFRVSTGEVAVQGNGGSFEPAISGYGRYVAFGSEADNLVPDDTNDFCDIFARDWGVPGDLNCNGTLDAFDIDPFVLALTDPTGYQAAYPDCDRSLADCNGDGTVNAFDIDPFVELLVGP